MAAGGWIGRGPRLLLAAGVLLGVAVSVVAYTVRGPHPIRATAIEVAGLLGAGTLLALGVAGWWTAGGRPWRPALVASAPAVTTYAAFISYSRKVDGRLAPAVQDGLQRFAKPWYRLRALRVFRDDASLAANPGLWPSIVSALDSS